MAQPAERSEAPLLHRTVAVVPMRNRPSGGGPAGAGDSLDPCRQRDREDGAPRRPTVAEPAARKCAANSGIGRG